MVRVMGLEPTRPVEHKHLKLACLPIPAHSQMSPSKRMLDYYTTLRRFVKGRNATFLALWQNDCQDAARYAILLTDSPAPDRWARRIPNPHRRGLWSTLT